MCLGLASGYIEPKEEKKMSLLKPYTNFEKIKAMDINEMAYTLMCPYDKDCDTDDFCIGRNCIECTKEWLESEVIK